MSEKVESILPQRHLVRAVWEMVCDKLVLHGLLSAAIVRKVEGRLRLREYAKRVLAGTWHTQVEATRTADFWKLAP